MKPYILPTILTALFLLTAKHFTSQPTHDEALILILVWAPVLLILASSWPIKGKSK